MRALDGTRMVTEFLKETAREVRYALRALTRNRSFTVAAVLSLGLGIGSSVAMFSVVDAAFLNPLPYDEPERLIAVYGTSPKSRTNSVSYPNYRDWRDRIRTVDDIAAWHLEMFTLTGRIQAERLIGGRVSAGYFKVLRVQPLLGRTFNDQEDRIGGPPVVLLGENLWRRTFAADPTIVGEIVTLNNEPHTVIGVIPEHVGVGVIARLYNDLFLPIGQNDDQMFLSRHVNAMNVIGRLRPGVDLAEVRADFEMTARSLEIAYPEANKGVGVNVEPLEEALVGDLRPTLALLVASVALMLLIACANVSNLILARFTGRAHEFALRSSLGASRARVLAYALGETLCLATIGATMGVALAIWGTRAALSVIPSGLPDIVNVGINMRVLLVAATATLGTALVCAVVPALRVARPELGEMLLPVRRSGSARQHRAQHVFLVTQIALTLILLVGAGLMTRSLARLWRVDPGFDPRGVITFMTGLTDAVEPARVRAAFGQIADQLATVPGVEATSAVFGALPYTGNNNAVDFWLAGEPEPEGSDALLTLYSAVGPHHFRAMGIPLLKGRTFGIHDTSTSARVAIVDDAFARSVFQDRDPIGQRIHLDSDEPVEVVGVVGHVKHWGLDPVRPSGAKVQVYVPSDQLPAELVPMAARAFSVVVRSSRPPAEIVSALRAALRTIDSGQAMNNEGTMEGGLARSLASRRFSLILIATFAVLALVLSSVGIYGLTSYLVSERTAEIGVRMALGARRGDIVVAVFGSVGRVTALGIALGLVASVAASRFIAGMLFETSPTDLVTLAGVAVTLASVALAASYWPARRALTVDPIVALRND
jgi:predicted permease